MLRLIQRDDCALCDQAWEILHQAGVNDFESMYIDGDKALEQRFGHLVPVLCWQQNQLNWPFTVAQVKTWLLSLQKD